MTTIGPPPELTAYLRRQLAALSASSPVSERNTGPSSKLANQRTSKGQAGSASPKTRTASSRRGQPGAEDLATALARRIASIDRSDPDRRRKAFRVFLESVMLDEWGAQLINDPAFHQLVDTVQAQMETRPELRAMMSEAADRLLAG
jgi:hypothetical protein